jgi:fatty acid desaturase
MTRSPSQNQKINIGKSNIIGTKYLIVPFLFMSLMLFTLNKAFPMYLVGQIVGAVFFAQCFILLHEFGHRSFFKTNQLNTVFGHFFSVLVFIPYYNWLEIHDLHHKWTGWRDRDPTTEKTFSDRFSPKQEMIINFCWKYYIPLFTLGYRFGIYWKAEKLLRHLSLLSYKRCQKEMVLYGAFYLVTIFMYPYFYISILPALYMSFIITDILSLSQHSHIEMPISNEVNVEPLKFKEQSKYSRSLVFPGFISEYILFNFNYHEKHHEYPGMPCYHLSKIKDIDSKNTFPFIPWLKTVKGMKGVDFIFKTSSNRTGF